MLATATLACAFATQDDPLEEMGILSTVTPGGRISVSLLTATGTTNRPVGRDGTPIAEIATATASAGTAVAQTATALMPTPTIMGIFSEPARCPQAGTPTLPTTPPIFSRFPQTIVEYLSDGGAPTILEARLRAWGSLPDYGGNVITDRDFTGDGVRDVLVVALDPARTEFPYPGDLFVFGCDDGEYSLLYQLGFDTERSFPLLRAADDVNGDLLNDIVFATQTCTEPICEMTLEVLSWDLRLNNFTSLLAENINEASAEVELADLNEDGVSEIIVTTGVTALATAGPQRIYTTTIRWNGTLYTVAEVELFTAQYRIHVLHEADDAILQGDYVTAVEMYQQAMTDDELASWTYPEEDAHLRAYAQFRLMLAFAAQDDLVNAQRVRDELLIQYSLVVPEETQPFVGENGDENTTPIPTPTPAMTATPVPVTTKAGSGFAELARAFWNSFALNRDINIGCQAVRTYATVSPDVFAVLNSFGYGNRSYEAADLCPYPQP